jgi:hypothetical protein
MASNSYKKATPLVTQADGVQVIAVNGVYRFFQFAVTATGATGTLAVEYLVDGVFYDLLDPVTNAALVIDLASITGVYPFEAIIDGIKITPTSVVGNYSAELRGIE